MNLSANNNLLDYLNIGVITFQDKRFAFANQSALSLLDITKDQAENNKFGLYEKSLFELLDIKEDKYIKQLTGVIGKPLTAILHITKDQIIIEIQESSETKLGEIAHELRRPLTNIKTLVDTLYLWGAGEDPAVRGKFLGQLHEQVNRLATMMNDLLSLSRMQAGSIPLNFQQIALKVLVQDAFNLLKEQAEKNQIELISEISDSFVLIADMDKIDHVVQNLIENAIRYNKPNGKVIVTADQKDNSFSVSDTGCGIAQENISKVFERFKRVSKNIPGTGLGLSIVKTIVDLHGGKIDLTSKEGEGSKFKVIIPKKPIVKAPV